MIYPAERLAAYLSADVSPSSICRQLVDAANEAGGEDNISVLVVRVEESDA
jgi:serine/threonine protein phosphatase PrpC